MQPVPVRIRPLQALALLAPAVGALAARLPLPYPEPTGFWRGLVVQLFLLLAPLDVLRSGRRWSALGLGAAGAGRSLAVGALYSGAYLGLLLAAAARGVHIPHFDAARRVLGLPVVLALYVPFWGVLEGVWIAYVLYAGQPAASRRPSWRRLAAGSAWFGLLHVFVQWTLYRTPASVAAGYVLVGAVFALAGSVALWTGNAWGTVLFWVVSNF